MQEVNLSRLLYFSKEVPSIVWLDDGRIVQTTLRQQDVQLSTAMAIDSVRILDDKGYIPHDDSVNITLHLCDGCKQDWGLRKSKSPAPTEVRLYQVLTNQRLLLFGHPSWYGGRDGFYCMGCSMPPR